MAKSEELKRLDDNGLSAEDTSLVEQFLDKRSEKARLIKKIRGRSQIIKEGEALSLEDDSLGGYATRVQIAKIDMLNMRDSESSLADEEQILLEQMSQSARIELKHALASASLLEKMDKFII